MLVQVREAIISLKKPNKHISETVKTVKII